MTPTAMAAPSDTTHTTSTAQWGKSDEAEPAWRGPSTGVMSSGDADGAKGSDIQALDPSAVSVSPVR